MNITATIGEREGAPRMCSTTIADVFGKAHNDILIDFINLEKPFAFKFEHFKPAINEQNSLVFYASKQGVDALCSNYLKGHAPAIRERLRQAFDRVCVHHDAVIAFWSSVLCRGDLSNYVGTEDCREWFTSPVAIKDPKPFVEDFRAFLFEQSVMIENPECSLVRYGEYLGVRDWVFPPLPIMRKRNFEWLSEL